MNWETKWLAQFSSLSSFHLAEMQLADVAILSANESSLILAFYCRHCIYFLLESTRIISCNCRRLNCYEVNWSARSNLFSNIIYVRLISKRIQHALITYNIEMQPPICQLVFLTDRITCRQLLNNYSSRISIYLINCRSSVEQINRHLAYYIYGEKIANKIFFT